MKFNAIVPSLKIFWLVFFFRGILESYHYRSILKFACFILSANPTIMMSGKGWLCYCLRDCSNVLLLVKFLRNTFA